MGIVSTWVLIIMIQGITGAATGSAVATHEFLGEKACLSAGEAVKSAARRSMDVRFVCVKKGN